VHGLNQGFSCSCLDLDPVVELFVNVLCASHIVLEIPSSHIDGCLY
jgi:hypothetical protein